MLPTMFRFSAIRLRCWRWWSKTFFQALPTWCSVESLITKQNLCSSCLPDAIISSCGALAAKSLDNASTRHRISQVHHVERVSP